MQHLPLRGEPILDPQPLDMNERTLPLTKQQMLQSRQRQQVVFGVGHLDSAMNGDSLGKSFLVDRDGVI